MRSVMAVVVPDIVFSMREDQIKEGVDGVEGGSEGLRGLEEREGFRR